MSNQLISDIWRIIAKYLDRSSSCMLSISCKYFKNMFYKPSYWNILLLAIEDKHINIFKYGHMQGAGLNLYAANLCHIVGQMELLEYLSLHYFYKIKYYSDMIISEAALKSCLKTIKFMYKLNPCSTSLYYLMRNNVKTFEVIDFILENRNKDVDGNVHINSLVSQENNTIVNYIYNEVDDNLKNGIVWNLLYKHPHIWPEEFTFIKNHADIVIIKQHLDAFKKMNLSRWDLMVNLGRMDKPHTRIKWLLDNDLMQ